MAELADHHLDHLGGFGTFHGRLAGAAQFANGATRQFRQSLEQVSSWPGRIEQDTAHVADHLGVRRQHLGHRGIPGCGNAPGRAVGPKRSRYLDKLRRDPAISALINAAHGRRGA